MLKNMKKLIAIALPVLTLSLTSCDRGAKLLSYEKARKFVADTYDGNALDTVPMVYTGNFNKMEANVDVSYVTPQGGSDSSNIAFGFNGIHVTVNDRYAICLSSTLLDTIERYYSDFVSFALTIQDETPIDLNYILIDNSSTRVAFTTSDKMVGSLLIRLLQMLASTVDLTSSAVGYIPTIVGIQTETDEQTHKITYDFYPKAKTEAIQEVQEMIFEVIDIFYKIEESTSDATDAMNFIIDFMNYVSFSVFDSSEAHGEVFHTYLTTDKYGFFRDLDFIFTSSFEINGLIAMKEYDLEDPRKGPQEGDRPKATLEPYRYSLAGSFDFDFNINAKYAK